MSLESSSLKVTFTLSSLKVTRVGEIASEAIGLFTGLSERATTTSSEVVGKVVVMAMQNGATYGTTGENSDLNATGGVLVDAFASLRTLDLEQGPLDPTTPFRP